jgi:hypothetical protein
MQTPMKSLADKQPSGELIVGTLVEANPGKQEIS